MSLLHENWLMWIFTKKNVANRCTFFTFTPSSSKYKKPSLAAQLYLPFRRNHLITDGNVLILHIPKLSVCSPS